MANFVFQIFAMPLFYQHNINRDTKLAIWRMEEPESFFLKKTPLIQDITHPHKRLQHLAGRYLLPILFDDFPVQDILIGDSRKPFLRADRYHFSISHCKDFAAAIGSKTQRVGVDVEITALRILAIGHKFLSQAEFKLLTGKQSFAENGNPIQHADWLTLLWSAKEAIFKWHGQGGINFIEHIELKEIETGQPDDWIRLSFNFQKGTIVPLVVHGKFFNNLALAWVVS
jgi:phosphopantetheinyl transferase